MCGLAVEDSENVPRESKDGICGLSLSSLHGWNGVKDLKHQGKCVDYVNAIAGHNENLSIML